MGSTVRQAHPLTQANPPHSHKNKIPGESRGFFGDPAGARTQDPYIKSVMLYQLSYGINLKEPKSPKGLFRVANIQLNLFYGYFFKKNLIGICGQLA
jgi:hypothetical protein